MEGESLTLIHDNNFQTVLFPLGFSTNSKSATLPYFKM